MNDLIKEKFNLSYLILILYYDLVDNRDNRKKEKKMYGRTRLRKKRRNHLRKRYFGDNEKEETRIKKNGSD